MKLTINFVDFWPNFDRGNNYFWSLLSKHYQLELADEPDVLFFSVFGEAHKNFNCLKIFYTGECYTPKFSNAHLSISFSRSLDPRNYRFPLYPLFFDIRKLLNKPDPETIFKSKHKFCCFVVSNKNCKIRNDFFHLLSKYKKVDSGGRYLNNVGGSVPDKLAFIQDYKFVIAFENKSSPGYITEKIIEPMRVQSVPIYWGDWEVGKDFNANSFVNIHDFSSLKEAVKYIIKLDNDDDAYKKMLAEPWLINNKVNEDFLEDSLLKKLVSVIDNRNELLKTPLAQESAIAAFMDRINRKLKGERTFY